jgi:hypothetical protein
VFVSVILNGSFLTTPMGDSYVFGEFFVSYAKKFKFSSLVILKNAAKASNTYESPIPESHAGFQNNPLVSHGSVRSNCVDKIPLQEVSSKTTK